MTDSVRLSQETPASLETLVDVIVDDARAAVGLLRDRAVNTGRELVLAAEEHIEALERAACDLGRVRGLAGEESLRREADQEIQGVVDGAFDRLFERFEMSVRTALEGLAGTPRYAVALAAWARAAASAMDRPADVLAAHADAERVYDALLEAGAHDFQVRPDRDVNVGFVVRDLDGRTLLDRRPAAIVAEHTAGLRSLLRRRAPAPPEGEA